MSALTENMFERERQHFGQTSAVSARIWERVSGTTGRAHAVAPLAWPPHAVDGHVNGPGADSWVDCSSMVSPSGSASRNFVSDNIRWCIRTHVLPTFFRCVGTCTNAAQSLPARHSTFTPNLRGK